MTDTKLTEERVEQRHIDWLYAIWKRMRWTGYDIGMFYDLMPRLHALLDQHKPAPPTHPLEKLVEKMTDIPPEFAKIVRDGFWEMVDGKSAPPAVNTDTHRQVGPNTDTYEEPK
jgi:hypothetical protein